MRGIKAVAILILLLGLCAGSSRAALQFDIFAGYGSEGCIREGAWYPVVCEINNDGPGFNAVIELTAEGWGGSGGQLRRVPIELPTNTRKRIFVPIYCSAGPFGGNVAVSGKLLDGGGKLRAERQGVTTRKVAWDSTLLGSLAKTFGGSPSLPEVKSGRAEMTPMVAKFQVDQFPDSPIALEGLSAVYLNSEKALDLKVPQISALLAWVREGGHLIISVEELADINSTPWLKQFVPMELNATRAIPINAEVLNWVRNQPGGNEVDANVSAGGRRTRRMMQPTGNAYADLPNDSAFQGPELPIALGTVRDGDVLFSAQNVPLAVQAPRGRGKITLLAFSPEREPFRSWKARPYFWAKLCGVPGDFFTATDRFGYNSASTDGIFGALIDSRQIRKLPVTWLLLLLVVYLVVIGPFDQWWLKKINRQMLTWITFPTYVVLFSVLIYFIGYKLRAGETEWNELNIVDVLPRGSQVDLWGRTYISVYSSGNAWYDLAGQKGHAAIRTENASFRTAGRDNAKMRVTQDGDSFKAEIFVPVWTSLLYANEWFKTNDTPFVAHVSELPSGYELEIENLLDRPLAQVRVVAGQTIFEAPAVAAHEKKTVRLNPENGTRLRNFVQQSGSYFQHAVDARQNAFGDNSGGRIEDRPLTTTTVSFISYLDEMSPGARTFIPPPGLDLTAQAERGDAIIFAWVPDFSLAEKINNFRPPRFKQDTMLRLTVPVRAKKTL